MKPMRLSSPGGSSGGRRPNSHPIPDEFLLDYAAGTAPEPVSVLVATHVALCSDSRAALRNLEAAGGALLNNIVPMPVTPDALERVMARLGPQQQRPHQPSAAARAADPALPSPLQAYAPAGLAALPWRSRGWGLSEAALPCATSSPYRMSLLRIGAGGSIPRHTHRGPELVLILAGGFSDQHGHYGRGDICYADESVEHRPTADADAECLCLAVTRGPIRLKGLLGLLLTPFIRD
jgi:putative transcriptional regulator